MREALAEHTVVWLQVSAETAWERAVGDDRPLASDRDVFFALHAERQPVYAAAADAFLPEGDRGLVERALPALRALSAAPPGTKLVWARTAGGEYPVYVGRGIAGSVLPGADGGRAFLVTDENVGPLYAARMRGVQHTITIAAGEEHKTLAAAEGVWRALAREGMGHGDHVVALGGGVVGDLAGFCAATYQRGVAVVQVPTTVVAQVDSAYGGKTGVDLPEAKNYVGAYHQPSAVITDVDTLATLPAAELAAGYAEVVKTALIAGGSLWRRVADGGAPDDEAIILDCARMQARGRRGRRARRRHAPGPEPRPHRRPRDRDRDELPPLSPRRGGRRSACSPRCGWRHAASCASRWPSCWRAAGLPTRLEGADPAAVVAATKLDKKRRGADVPFVLVRAPGEVSHGQRVSEQDVLAAVAELAAPAG